MSQRANPTLSSRVQDRRATGRKFPIIQTVSTSALRRFLTHAFGAALLCGNALLAAAGSAHAGPPAVVTCSMTANWGSGFQALVTITPGAAVTSWSLEFDAAEAQQVTNSFYAGATQTGRHVVLTNRSFNGSIAAGATVNLGLQFSNPALINVPPSGFVFNGETAAYSPQPYIHAAERTPTVPEGGSTPVAVTLSQAPTTTETLQIGQGSASAVTAAPQRLTFTPANWNVPQTLTLTSPRDADTANQTAWISLSTWSGTPFYAYEFLLATQLDNG